MPKLPSDLTPLAKEFVWLLREDARELTKGAGPESESFRQWWIARGRSDYLGWTDLTSQDKTFLSEKTGTYTFNNITIPLPRAMSLVLQYRADVVKKFTVNKEVDSLSLTAWFFAYGIAEMKLTDIIDTEMLQVLDRPAPIKVDESDVPAPTLLMYLAWHLLNPDVKKTMPLETGKTRAQFMAWFFSEADKSFHLTDLIAGRWRQWLFQDVVITNKIKVPRFVAESLNSSVEMRESFDLNSSVAQEKLQDWASEALKENGDWAWLKKTEPKKLPIETKTNRPFGVNLFGFAFGELGTGEDLRMAVAACESAMIPYRIVNISTGSNLRQADLVLKDKVAQSVDEAPYAINVFCLPGFDTIERIFLQKGEHFFRGHYNIGWWPWEISVWPKAWSRAFDLMDEIWAGSEFARAMYAKSTNLHVNIMPLGVSVDRGKLHPRSFYHLPDKKFLFLFVFDFNSHLDRKNPVAILDAFAEAFPESNQDVGLVLKVMNSDAGNFKWLSFQRLVKRDPRIILMEETLDRPDVLGLINACDAYVSLHRGEGFGRTLAEAMLYGKPVIATNYSGNVDFMMEGLSYPVDFTLQRIPRDAYPFLELTDGAEWAEPDVEDAAQKMRDAYRDSKDDSLSRDIKSFAANQFSVIGVGKNLRERLSQIDLKKIHDF
jgi:glycosyltransferase involved in cell wall biosynthesis